jgi:hypothetical protein
VAPNDRSDADESKSVEISAVKASTHLHAPPEGSVVRSTRHHSLTRASMRRQNVSTRLHAPDKLSARAIHAPSTDPGRFAPRASQTGLFRFSGQADPTVHGFRASAHTTDPNSNLVRTNQANRVKSSPVRPIQRSSGFGSDRPTCNRLDNQPGSAGLICQTGLSKPAGSSIQGVFLSGSLLLQSGSYRFESVPLPAQLAAAVSHQPPPPATFRQLLRPSKKKKISNRTTLLYYI